MDMILSIHGAILSFTQVYNNVCEPSIKQYVWYFYGSCCIGIFLVYILSLQLPEEFKEETERLKKITKWTRIGLLIITLYTICKQSMCINEQVPIILYLVFVGL